MNAAGFAKVKNTTVAADAGAMASGTTTTNVAFLTVEAVVDTPGHSNKAVGVRAATIRLLGFPSSTRRNL